MGIPRTWRGMFSPGPLVPDVPTGVLVIAQGLGELAAGGSCAAKRIPISSDHALTRAALSQVLGSARYYS